MSLPLSYKKRESIKSHYGEELDVSVFVKLFFDELNNEKVEDLKLKKNTITFDKAPGLAGRSTALFPAISRGHIFFEQKGEYIHIKTEIFFDHQLVRGFIVGLFGLTSFIYMSLQESFIIVGLMLAAQAGIYFFTIQHYLTFFYETFTKQSKKLEFLSYS